uniref:Uncharacterized protein n=1 Tax=Anopheles dirus TaxID=7168 RepID=A0A182MXB8_9DIPT
MNKATKATVFLLAVVLLVNYASAEHKKPDDKLSRIDNVDVELKPLESILGELEGLRVRRAAQGGQGGGQGGQGGQGGRRGPPDQGGQGQGRDGGQSGGQASGEN